MRRQPARPAPRLRGRAINVALSLLIAALAFAGPAAPVVVAAAPQQLNPIDLFGGGDGGTSDITDMVTLNGLTYFAGDMGSGTELLVSDGTQAGTHMVADINPAGDSYPNDFVVMGDKVYFAATDASGARLYASDGTMLGTQQVVRLGGSASNWPTHLTVIGDTLYFAADSNGDNWFRLYATDGTEHGTRLVKELGSSINPSREWSWAALNGKLYFPASDGSCAGLWVSDGTAEGTVELGAASGETWCSEVTHLTAAGSHLYMSSGTYMGSGEDLWISDGTTPGTFHMDLAPGFDSSLPGNFTAVGDIAYFTANDGTHGRELWRSDGTARGTYQVVDLTPAVGVDSIPHNFCGTTYDCEGPITSIGDTVFFAAGDGGDFPAIYRTDGTAAGTVPVTAANSFAALPMAVGSQLFYAQVSIMGGAVINVTDAQGSFSTTVLSRTVGDAYSLPTELSPGYNYIKFSGSHLWVSYFDGDIGVEVASIDVATVPTSEADPVITGNTSRVGSLLHADTGRWSAIGDLTYSYQWYRCTGASIGSCSEIAEAKAADYAIRGLDEGKSVRARVTARTNAGVAHRYTAARDILTSHWTTLDLNTGPDSSYAGGDPVQVGNYSYLPLFEPGVGYELYKSDGTIVGTTLVADICPGSCSSFPSELTSLNGILVFSAFVDGNTELWRSDGTSAGTYALTTFGGSATGAPYSLTATGSTLFFVGWDETYGRQLWISDGTVVGTHKAHAGADPVTMPYGAELLAVPRLYDSGVVVLFSASNGSSGTELWEFNVEADAFGGFDINPDGDSSPSSFRELNGAVYFLAYDPVHGRELRKLAYLESGPQLVAETLMGDQSGVAGDYMTLAGDKLYFNVYNSDTDQRYLYVSDGSTYGTQPISQTGSYFAGDFVASSDRVYYSLFTGDGHFDLYSSAGAPETTTKVYSSFDSALMSNGNTLFFTDINTDFTEMTLYSTSGTASSVTSVFTTATWPEGEITHALLMNGTLVLVEHSSTTGIELTFPDSTVPPLNTMPPAISFEPDNLYHADLAFGKVLTALNGTWIGNPTPTVHYQWLSCANNSLLSCSDISNAIAPTYRIRQADGGAYLRVRATGTSSAGSSSVVSEALSIPYSSLKPLDLNTGTDSSWAWGYTQAGAYTYFLARGAEGGYEELWRTDGTEAGTLQLTVCKSSNCNMGQIVAIGSTVFFHRFDQRYGDEVWKSTGTVAGTALLKDIIPGTDSSQPSNLTVLGKTLYFSAYAGGVGQELWKSDGTLAGTVLLKDINPGGGSWPASFLGVGSTLYFTAFTDANGAELWKTNGTAAGTVIVADSVAGSDGVYINNMVAVGSTLFYLGGVSGNVLWKSGGTAATTMAVPASTTYAQDLRALGTSVYYTYDDGVHGRELWKSDGTAGGTLLVKDIVSGSASSDPWSLISTGTQLFFSARDNAHGRELWHSGGTGATTTLVSDIRSGTEDSAISNFVAFNGGAYFVANDGTHGQEVWGSDGTAGGTSMVADVNPIVGGMDTWWGGDLVDVAGGKLWFSADDGNTGAEPWVSDGTQDGTYLLKDLVTLAASSEPSTPVVLGTTTYFYANDGVHGFELWQINEGSTPSMWDINPTGSSAYPGESNAEVQMVVSGNRLFFVADDGVHGPEIWSLTEGSAPTMSAEIVSGQGGDEQKWVGNLTARGNTGTVFFSAHDIVHGRELWMSDGSNTGMVSDLIVGAESSDPYNLRSIGSWIYFSAYADGIGRELWRSDGTSFQLVGDLNSGDGGSYPENITAAGGKVYFSALTSLLGHELFVVTEETPGSPMIENAADITAGSGDSYPNNLTEFNGDLYFTATAYGVTGNELFVVTGGEAKIVVDLCAGSCDSWPDSLTVVHGTVDRLYFLASYPSPSLLWIDGPNSVVHSVDTIGTPYMASLSSPTSGVLYSVMDTSHGFERYEIVSSDGHATFLGDVSTVTYEYPWSTEWSTCVDTNYWCNNLVESPAGYYAPGTTIGTGNELFYSALETAPVLDAAPLLTGTMTVGSVVTSDDGEWSSVPNPSFDYQPMLCASATSIHSCRNRGSSDDVASLTLTNADVGSYVRYKVTATTRAGSTVAYSAAKLVPVTAPVMAVAPGISGTAKVGYRIAASAGTYTGNPTPGLSYTWYRCTKAATAVTAVATVAGCTAITGARSSVYTVVTADIGKYIRVRITATSRGGTIYRWSKSSAKGVR